jgi:ubiquinone/menaquinone biosynthesis C-methylase UbiE
MEKKDYWLKYWNDNHILKKDDSHERVGRTINGVPITGEKWSKTLDFISQQMQLNHNDELMDIAAGNGSISIPFSKKVKKVLAIDISKKLLSEIPAESNIQTNLGDIRNTEFPDNSFTKIVFYFAIQHFSEKEVVQLVTKSYNWLAPGGILYIGDIPDAGKLFDFFNTEERRAAYFSSILTETPILGTWFERSFLAELGKFVGFDEQIIIAQPNYQINSHYRFDIKLIKTK